MRRIGSALAAGAATAGLFGAFALLNVATRPPVEQVALNSFAVDAPLPDAPAPAVARAAAARSDPPPAPMAAEVPVAIQVPVVASSPPATATVTAPAPMTVAAPSLVVPATAGGAAEAHPPTASPAPPGQGTAPAAPGSSGGSSYAARVRAWLLAHKRYPRRSRLQREEGVVQLRFVLDRAGHLLDGMLVAGSHHAALDAEAMAMLRRAVPYPAPPGDVRGDRIEIAAAVAFELPGR